MMSVFNLSAPPRTIRFKKLFTSYQELLLDQEMSSFEDGTMAKMSPLMLLLPAPYPQLMWQARQLKLARLLQKPMIGK